jgi:uncharacterized protein
MSQIEKIKREVEKILSCSAHNMDHVLRVYNLALHLAKNNKANLKILKSAVLLHDIARVEEDNDHTGKTDHAILGAKMAKPILEKLNFKEEEIKEIQNCIVSHRNRTENKPKTLEAKILFDADKLDALGVIGIARSFIWVGRNNAKIYQKINLKKYIKNNLCGKINGRIQNKTIHSPQIEFETKIKFLKEKLYTKQAKKIAQERLEFFKNFLNRLENEVKGKI